MNRVVLLGASGALAATFIVLIVVATGGTWWAWLLSATAAAMHLDDVRRWQRQTRTD